MVKLVDCIQNSILYEGKASIDEDKIQFENQIWYRQKNVLWIEKKADLRIKLCLKEGQVTLGTVQTEEGCLELEIETDRLVFKPDQWEVSYRLGNQDFHFRLLIK